MADNPLLTVTVGTTDYTFDWEHETIAVEAGVTEVSAADLKTAITTAEADPIGIVFAQIAEFFNPVNLTPTVTTFLTVRLLSGWRIESLSTSGTLTVQEGNVVNINNGIDIFFANALVNMVNNVSAAGVYLNTPEVVEMHQDMGLKSGAPVSITENTADTSYDQTSTGITKQIRTSGTTKTITRS